MNIIDHDATDRLKKLVCERGILGGELKYTRVCLLSAVMEMLERLEVLERLVRRPQSPGSIIGQEFTDGKSEGC